MLVIINNIYLLVIMNGLMIYLILMAVNDGRVGLMIRRMGINIIRCSMLTIRL
jgi:hypothetical protein